MKVDNEEQRKQLLGIIDSFPVNTNMLQAMQIVQVVFQIRQCVERAGLDDGPNDSATPGPVNP